MQTNAECPARDTPVQGTRSDSVYGSVSGGLIAEIRSLLFENHLLGEDMIFTDPAAGELPAIR